MKEIGLRNALITLALISSASHGGTLDLDFTADGSSTFSEFFSGGFYRMDLFSPPPFQTNQSFREIGNPTNIFNQAFDGFPRDEDFRFGSLTYDASMLVGGSGIANITGLNLGIAVDPDDPTHINSARWASGITTLVDTFSGTVTVTGGEITSADFTSDIRLSLLNVGGSTIPGIYEGTFSMSGLAFELNVAGEPAIDVFSSLPPRPFPLEWAFSGFLNAPEIPAGDFDGDGMFGCTDVNALVAEIVQGSNAANFDLTGDGAVNRDDLAAWLTAAGEANLGPGRAYLPGDADLSGAVDVSDFSIWNANKFTQLPAWCSGDFNADGAIDVSDFGIWNAAKFTASDGLFTVPEPSAGGLVLISLVAGGAFLRRRRRP